MSPETRLSRTSTTTKLKFIVKITQDSKLVGFPSKFVVIHPIIVIEVEVISPVIEVEVVSLVIKVEVVRLVI